MTRQSSPDFTFSPLPELLSSEWTTSWFAFWPKRIGPQQNERKTPKGYQCSLSRRSCQKQLAQLLCSLFSVSCALQLFLCLAWAKHQMTDVSVPAVQRGRVCDSCSCIWSCGWWGGAARALVAASFILFMNVYNPVQNDTVPLGHHWFTSQNKRLATLIMKL